MLASCIGHVPAEITTSIYVLRGGYHYPDVFASRGLHSRSFRTEARIGYRTGKGEYNRCYLIYKQVLYDEKRLHILHFDLVTIIHIEAFFLGAVVSSGVDVDDRSIEHRVRFAASRLYASSGYAMNDTSRRESPRSLESSILQ